MRGGGAGDALKDEVRMKTLYAKPKIPVKMLICALISCVTKGKMNSPKLSVLSFGP